MICESVCLVDPVYHNDPEALILPPNNTLQKKLHLFHTESLKSLCLIHYEHADKKERLWSRQVEADIINGLIDSKLSMEPCLKDTCII